MINLLPPSYRRQQIVRRRAAQWSGVICTVLALGWAWHWYELREYRELSQRFEVLAREHRPTQVMLSQLVDMRQKLVDLKQQDTIASELEHHRNALTLLGAISDATKKTNGRLRVTQLQLTNFQPIQGSPDAAGAETGGLVLTGVSIDNPAVAELLDGLQNAGIFSRVELLTLKERETDDTLLRDYEVRCEF
jgi:hypothetical protein